MDTSSSLIEYKISDGIVNNYLEFLDIFKEAKYEATDVTTRNGFQTKNILTYQSAKDLTKELLSEIGNITNGLDCFHIHLIEYFKQGHQEAHNHKRTEDFSFILYLNDADGNTVFENIGEIGPKKGKLIYFKSDLMHWSKQSIRNKKIAVGALKTID